VSDGGRVAILGGGLAGLAAAERLGDAGVDVTLLEARDRLGGRIFTVRPPGGPAVELGAEWIGAEGSVRERLAAGGTELVTADGSHLRRRDGRLEDFGVAMRSVQRLLASLRSHGPDDRSLGRALRDLGDRAGEADARDLLQGYVEGFNAADASRVSVRWLAEVEANQPPDASELRAPDGVGRIVDLLVASIGDRVAIRRGAVARRVGWRPGRVEIDVESAAGADRVDASTLIVTLPLGVLKLDPGDPAAVRFDPPLESKRDALDRLEMGAVVKIVGRFRSRFWRRGELSDLLFIHAFEQALPTWWTAAPLDAPILVGWVGGPLALRLASARRAELTDHAVGSAAAALGVPRSVVEAELVEWHWHDWQADPFARGAYSYVLAGGIDAPRELAEPVAETLYFAGEATVGGGANATMEGALQSGYRAADQALAALR
jgi:monoamine oxidase